MSSQISSNPSDNLTSENKRLCSREKTIISCHVQRTIARPQSSTQAFYSRAIACPLDEERNLVMSPKCTRATHSIW